MATKTPEILTQDFLNNPNVNSAISFNINQADIVDMLVSEHEENLANQESDIVAQINDTRSSIGDQDKINATVAQDFLTKNYKKIIDGLSALPDSELEFSIRNGYSDDDCYRVTVSVESEVLSGSFTFKASADELVKTSKAFAKNNELRNKLVALQDSLSALHAEQAGLGKMGKRAKAKLVKSVLGNTVEGQKLLAKATEVTSKMKLLKA